MSGYIYILINPSLHGMVKIGKTSREPKVRAKELTRATGVPTPFSVAYSVYVNDCDAAEKYVHDFFSAKGTRLSNNREFFEVDLPDAINVLLKCEEIFSLTDLDDSYDEDESLYADNEDLRKYGKAYQLYHSIYIDGVNHFDGGDGCFKDHRKAEKLLQKALSLGSIQAANFLASLYVYSNELRNLRKSIETYHKALQLINEFRIKKLGEANFLEDEFESLNELAKVYFLAGEVENSKKVISLISEKFSTAMISFLSILEKWDVNSDISQFYDLLRDEVSKTSDRDFFDKLSIIQRYFFNYFQDISNGELPITNLDCITVDNFDFLYKVKYRYTHFETETIKFLEGFSIYKRNFIIENPSIHADEITDNNFKIDVKPQIDTLEQDLNFTCRTVLLERRKAKTSQFIYAFIFILLCLFMFSALN